ncbi:MAG TPA: hypothetical protein VLQ67_01410, partial [Arachnia sp.]|nr:hypothetical protein [Arachnia sp.]
NYRKNLKQLPTGNERFNAIWVKLTEDRPAVWAWKRADFDKLNSEYRTKGFRLMELNAFVLPGGQDERYNAIWVKSTEDRPAVWAWKRADFDKLNSEYRAKGFRLMELNAFVLPGGREERYNAIWVKSTEDRPAVRAWVRWDFESLHSEHHAKGYRLHSLRCFVVS